MNNQNNKKKLIVEYIAQKFDVRGNSISSHKQTETAYKMLREQTANPEYNWEGLAHNVDTPKIPYFYEYMGKNVVTLDDYITFLQDVDLSNKDENTDVCFKSYVGTRFYKEMCYNLYALNCAPEVASEDGSKLEYSLSVQVPEIQWVFKDPSTGRVVSKTQKPGVENAYIKIDATDTLAISAVKEALTSAIKSSENPNNYRNIANQQYADYSQQEDLHAIISGHEC